MLFVYKSSRPLSFHDVQNSSKSIGQNGTVRLSNLLHALPSGSYTKLYDESCERIHNLTSNGASIIAPEAKQELMTLLQLLHDRILFIPNTTQVWSADSIHFSPTEDPLKTAFDDAGMVSQMECHISISCDPMDLIYLIWNMLGLKKNTRNMLFANDALIQHVWHPVGYLYHRILGQRGEQYVPQIWAIFDKNLASLLYHRILEL